MYIKKEHVIEAILYKGVNKDEVMKKFSDLTDELISKIPNGNYIIKDSENVISNLSPADFNRQYTELKLIENISTHVYSEANTMETIEGTSL